MRKAKIVLVAEWDGWCGACAVERPLVLTRTGRLGLRTWLTAPVTESRPLTLTCRLCGQSTVVPPEADDPPVLVEPDEVRAQVSTAAPLSTAGPAAAPPPARAVAETSVAAAPSALLAPPTVEITPVTPAPAAPVHRSAELDQARSELGSALGALLAERTAQAARVTLAPSVPVLAPSVPALAPAVPAVAAPALPLQRTSSADTDGLATLQLLADGLDLLSSTRR